MIITGELLYMCLCRATPRVICRTWDELELWAQAVYEHMANILMEEMRREASYETP